MLRCVLLDGYVFYFYRLISGKGCDDTSYSNLNLANDARNLRKQVEIYSLNFDFSSHRTKNKIKEDLVFILKDDYSFCEPLVAVM